MRQPRRQLALCGNLDMMMLQALLKIEHLLLGCSSMLSKLEG